MQFKKKIIQTLRWWQSKWFWKYASSNPWQQVPVLLLLRTVTAASATQSWQHRAGKATARFLPKRTVLAVALPSVPPA